MARPTPARTAALEVLRGVRAGGLADQAFDRAATPLDARDRAWMHELVYGTLRLRGRLDFRLAHASSRPLESLDAEVLDVLRLGAYQLLEMGGVPAYAAVSESVELTRRRHRSAAGFVNAVLQTLRRAPDAPTFPSLEADPVGHLSTWGSHPRWLVERWVDRYGAEEAARLVEANNRRPELYLRILSGSAPEVVAALRDAGVTTETVPFARAALHVSGGAIATALDAAPVIVQDPAAGLVVDYGFAAAQDGSVMRPSVVLDLAAAPGGKALAAAFANDADAVRPGNGAPAGDGAPFVAAADRSARRLGRLVENVRRLERQPETRRPAVGAVVADARHAPFRPAGVVLLDAPCTGTGTLRRHPDGRWRLQPEDLDGLGALQRDMLDAAATAVAPGGLLLYSTCSLEPEENEDQVAGFLQRHEEFAVERGTGVDEAMISDAGALHVLPQAYGVDGAYAVRLRRAGDAPGRGAAAHAR